MNTTKFEQTFGDYKIEVDGNHAVITRKDGEPAQPTFYEMQYMKDLAFRGCGTAVEIFPQHRHLVDGENQRHLWQVDTDSVPNLYTENLVKHSEE